MFAGWRRRAEDLRRDVMALYFACRDPRVPWYAKAFMALLVAYALSPIDLIPDFIPVLGYLDELILLPLGVLLAVRMIPADILAGHRERARLASERTTQLAGSRHHRHGLAYGGHGRRDPAFTKGRLVIRVAVQRAAWPALERA
jgi:uncharacterized membrane protein YkvA (DUF1232 family)